MIDRDRFKQFAVGIRTGLIVLSGLVAFIAQPALASITVTVVDENGVAVNGFKWTLEQDPTYQVEPGVRPTSITDVLSFGFHKSYSPVAQTGETPAGNNTATINGTDAASGPYFVSVIPYSSTSGGTYTIGGAQVRDGDNVTVVAHSGPLPTAQISVLVFEDNAPVNGAPDFGAGLGAGAEISERPLTSADGKFAVLLEDAGGRYGVSGGQVTLDAFGNPLGTKYRDVSNPAFDPEDPAFIDSLGDGTFEPDDNGILLIENLAPGKYGVQVVPPAGSGWHQTSTIEGSKVIDAWVKANEPTAFVEFGPPGPHVFIGFIKDIDASSRTGSVTVSGQIRNNHMSRPPDFAFYNGNPFPGCYVGLNSGAGRGTAIAAQPCNDDSTFEIHNVPSGSYTVAVWDKFLNIVIAQLPVDVPEGSSGNIDLGDLTVFNWFGRLESAVFIDTNRNGIRDPGEQDMPADSTEVILRFRDGTVYQAFPVDTEGLAPFDTVFPFFHWLVAEVGFASLQATGATYTVDAGGPVELDGDNVLTPQPTLCTQADIDNAEENGLVPCTIDTPIGTSRTLVGEVLTMGIQTFLGQTNRIEFGKAPYEGQDNGGISGVIFYSTTRAEDDPRFAAGEEWEPGIPRVQVNLYQSNGAGEMVDQDGDGVITAPDVDRAPLGNFPGPEDTDNSAGGLNQAAGRFDYGDAVQVTWTDSWDDSLPESCQGELFNAYGTTPTDCFDGLRNFNQMREAVFDGGYAFASYKARAYDNDGDLFGPVTYSADAVYGDEVDSLPTNLYIVEAITPPGYKHVKEEDRNVDFGDEFIPQPNFGVLKAAARDRDILEKLSRFVLDGSGISVDLTAPAACVGDEREVPALFSFLTFANGDPLPGVVADDDSAAPFALENRPLCDRKVVALTPGKNAAADFFMFTDVPVAAHVVGGMLDDLSNEFDPNSPNFGEKYAPPWLPVVFRDWTGREIYRTHADEYGKYNAMLPSTYTISQPHPSGVSPSMITACMNDASPIVDPLTGDLVPDPYRDARYSQFCYTFQYMPGTITYLDTPVVPISAFAGKDQFPLDCAVSDNTPEIYSVTSGQDGPWASGTGFFTTLTIRSAGMTEVLNESFGPGGEPNKTELRDYGFGPIFGPGFVRGQVVLKDKTGVERSLSVASWNDDTVNARVLYVGPSAVPAGQHQLIVQKADGTRNRVGVTVTVGGDAPITVGSTGADHTTIQAAIDAAAPGDLITIAPGVYQELVVMNKPVQLQGWGARSTIINATIAPGESLDAWRATMLDSHTAGLWDELPGQEQETAGGLMEAQAFIRDEGAGITVVGSNPDDNDAGPGVLPFGAAGLDPRIDGVTITGAVRGGGILVNGYADNLQISNNRVVSNAGDAGGGVRIGDSTVFDEGQPTDAQNDNVLIHNNHIAQNGTLQAAGAGVALFTGADDYEVSSNYICGNFSQGHGAGIGHLGLSDGGLISGNDILFNQSFNQGVDVHGGGVFIGGFGGVLGLSPGSGSVTVDANLIQGNNAGAGNGAGIRTQFVNGMDVDDNPDSPASWHTIEIFNNMIVNNVTGLSGGGISLQDTARVVIHNNTIANNDSTATAGLAFGSPNSSLPQPGVGIAVHPHLQDAATTTLIDVFGSVNAARYLEGISNPVQSNNIIWHNRQFSWQVVSTNGDEECFELLPNVSPTATACGTPANETPVYDDLAVVGSAATLLPVTYTVFSETYTGPGAGGSTNELANDDAIRLATPYVNGGGGQTLIQQELTVGIAVQPALDEGGNFIDVRYGPLTPSGNYHIGHAASVAINSGSMGPVNSNLLLTTDFDGDSRPFSGGPDIGADETTGVFLDPWEAPAAGPAAKTGATASGGAAGGSGASGASSSGSNVTGVSLSIESVLQSVDGEIVTEDDEDEEDNEPVVIEISPFALGTDATQNSGESQ